MYRLRPALRVPYNRQFCYVPVVDEFQYRLSFTSEIAPFRTIVRCNLKRVRARMISKILRQIPQSLSVAPLSAGKEKNRGSRIFLTMLRGEFAPPDFYILFFHWICFRPKSDFSYILYPILIKRCFFHNRKYILWAFPS